VAILSVGRVAARPVVRDGELQVRPTGTIAITFDHRVVDGARAAEFGLAVIQRLENESEAGGEGPPASARGGAGPPS
jgi:pyruvate dehydrogenase E2 component (dihydrolipoamide acetyltransferase)